MQVHVTQPIFVVRPRSFSQTTTTHYDSSLRPDQVTQPDGTMTSYQYYANGLVKLATGSQTFPAGYLYDGQGRLKQMTNWTTYSTIAPAGTRVTTWNYDIYRGWLTGKTYADGSAGPAYSYTLAGRLQSRQWARGTPQVTATYGYTAGDLSSITYNDGMPGQTLTYDRRGRLSTVAKNGITTTFAYNDADQQTNESYSGGTLDGLSVQQGYDSFLRPQTFTAYNGINSLTSATDAYGACWEDVVKHLTIVVFPGFV